jgi:phosphoserine phosphatase
MHRIFLSSTFSDLAEHREAALAAIRQLGAVEVAMENFGARSERPKDEVLRLIREGSDVFVGVYAHRYGSIPDGDEISITQLEYLEARRAKLPTFVYLVDKAYPWPKDQIDAGAALKKLGAFLEVVRRERIFERFTTPDSLAAALAADLGRHFLGDKDRPLEVHGLVHSPPLDWVSPARRNPWRYKVVALDLDGTLLRGADFEFSWEAIWTSLGFTSGIQRDLKREYRQRSGHGASREERIAAYQAWCDKAVEQFRSRGLTRDQLRDLAKPLSLTRNCKRALRQLRREGFTIAIVSGGVNTFLDDKFPDFRQLVDFAFINELTFTNEGALDGVLATAYDFEGKSEALDLVCASAECTRSEAVFVGDHFNDEAIMLMAGLAIAYPANDVVARGAANVEVHKDDLLAVLPRILVE